MHGLHEAIAGQLGGHLGAIAELIGADEKKTAAAMGAALPLMLGALARQAETTEGAKGLFGSIEEQDDGILDDLGGLLKNPAVLAAGGLAVRKIFGGRQKAVESGLAKSTGLSAAQVGKMLAFAAPVVLGSLRRRQKSEGLDAAGLGGLLRAEREGLTRKQPELGGFLGALDRDNDGEVMDDIARMGGVVLGAGLIGKLFHRN
jgi:hypothetical protein